VHLTIPLVPFAMLHNFYVNVFGGLFFSESQFSLEMKSDVCVLLLESEASKLERHLGRHTFSTGMSTRNIEGSRRNSRFWESEHKWGLSVHEHLCTKCKWKLGCYVIVCTLAFWNSLFDCQRSASKSLTGKWKEWLVCCVCVCTSLHAMLMY